MKSPTQGSLQFVVFATAVTAIGGFLFGYDTAVINGANSYLKAHLHLTPTQEGLAGASAIAGCIPGAMFAGFLSDKFGRKKLLFLCALLYAVSGVLSAIPRTFDQFLIARFLSGLGIGASSMICPVYIAEISPEKWRGRLGTLFQLGIVAGIFLTLFINKVIQGLGDEAWNTAMGWRWMLGMEAVPALVFIGLLFTVPESPRWLAQNGREDEARGILGKVAGAAQAEIELAAIRSAAGQEEGRFAELFSRAYRRPLLIAVLLMMCSQFCGINAIMYYSTKIFESAGSLKDAAFTSSVWIGADQPVVHVRGHRVRGQGGAASVTAHWHGRPVRGAGHGGMDVSHPEQRLRLAHLGHGVHRRLRHGHGADPVDPLLGDLPEQGARAGDVRGHVHHLGLVLRGGANLPDAQ